MQNENKRTEIKFRLDEETKQTTVEIPEITDEHALEFGRTLLLLRSYESAIPTIENQMKLLFSGIDEFRDFVDQIRTAFYDCLNDDVCLSESEFAEMFAHLSRLPTADDTIRAFKQISDLRKQLSEIKIKTKELTDNTSRLDLFGLSFGRTFRQTLDDLERTIEENTEAANLKWDHKMTGDKWAKEKEKAVRIKKMSFSDHEILSADIPINKYDLVWNIAKQNFLFPDSEIIGNIANNFVLVLRRAAQPIIPVGYSPLSYDNSIRTGDYILREGAATWELVSTKEIGEYAVEFPTNTVIRQMPDHIGKN